MDELTLRSFQSAVRTECEACVAAKNAQNIPVAIQSCMTALCPLRPVRPYQQTPQIAYG